MTDSLGVLCFPEQVLQFGSYACSLQQQKRQAEACLSSRFPPMIPAYDSPPMIQGQVHFGCIPLRPDT
jgi:hypothetical protein